MQFRIYFLLLVVMGISACSDIRIKEHEEWKKYFDEYGVEGCFEVYDNNKETAHFYNKERCSEQICPASTFKIFNSLVALETGVAPDEQLMIKWDGVERWNKAWSKDMTMTEAFKLSSVPYYQELARRIGTKDMQHYLDTVNYGNKNIGNAIDQFWLNDELKISPDEQVGFVKRLYHGELPFNERSQRIVKGMMLQKQSEHYKLYYKTGWKQYKDSSNLWVVGFVEKENVLKHVETKKEQAIPHPYFFALNFTTKDTTLNNINVRLALLEKLLEANDLAE